MMVKVIIGITLGGKCVDDWVGTQWDTDDNIDTLDKKLHALQRAARNRIVPLSRAINKAWHETTQGGAK